jgi:hypothetical protein
MLVDEGFQDIRCQSAGLHEVDGTNDALQAWIARIGAHVVHQFLEVHVADHAVPVAVLANGKRVCASMWAAIRASVRDCAVDSIDT